MCTYQKTFVAPPCLYQSKINQHFKNLTNVIIDVFVDNLSLNCMRCDRLNNKKLL